MKKIQKKGRTSLKDALIGWFNKPIDVKSIITTKAPVKASDKARNKAEKTFTSKSMAKLKERLKGEFLARAEVEKRLKTEIKAREKAEARLKAESKKRQRFQAKAKDVKVEEEVEGEEKFRSCTNEIKDCIELINTSSGGSAGKPNRDSEDADMDNIESKTGRDVDKGTKNSRQGATPAEMLMLLAKAEGKISKAVIEAKEKDDKKAKRKRQKN